MSRKRRIRGGFRFQIESLEVRRLLAAVTWISSSSGDWDTASNWSTGVVPGAGDDVTINMPGITVTHGIGTDSVHSIVSDDAFTLSGGTLNVATTMQVNNTFDLSGGTLQGATVNPGSGGQDVSVFGFMSFLDGVTLNANLDMTLANGVQVTVTNGLTLNATTEIGDAPGTNNGTLVVDNGSATNASITGSGNIIFGSGSSNSLINGSNSSLDIGVQIGGTSGDILNQNSSGTIVNQNIVDANQSGSQILFSGAGTLINQGTFEADNGGTVSIETHWAGQGILIANNGGTIDISGGYIAAPGGNADIGIGSGGAGAISVSGPAVLNGNLNISLLPGFVPTVGTVYTIATFTSVSGSYNFNGLASGNVTLTPSLSSVALALTVGAAKTIGGLDPNFGTNGLASHNVGITSVAGVLEQPNGQSVICGTAGNAPDQTFALTRYNADGSLDMNFGTNGVVTTSIGSGNDEAGDVELLSNGDILVAGTVVTSSGSEFALAEYTSAGALDTTFGNGTGFVVTSFSTTAGVLTDDTARALAVASNGTIYLGGSSNAANKGLDFAIASYSANGTPNTSFGTNGTALLDFSGGDDVVNALAVESNGDVVAAGSTTNPSSGVVSVALARFLPNGTIDTHFGAKGKVVTGVQGVADVATSIALESAGKIVIGGLSATGSPSDGSLTSDFLVARYTSTGAIDRTFGGGPVVTSFGQPAGITQILVESNGDILASGKTVASLSGLNTSQLEVALARYTSAGKLDTTFNTTGTAIISLSGTASPGFATPDLIFSADFVLSPDDTASQLLSEFQSFEQSAQGVIATTSGGELLAVGNSGANTVEAAIVTAGIELATALIAKLPASALGGAKESLTVKITESGTDPAVGTVTIQLLASPTGLSDLGEPPFDSVPEHLNLKAGHSQSFVVHYTLPTTAGTFNIVANVSSGSLQELNGINNAAASATQVAVAAPFVELTGSDLSFSGSITPGKTATISFNVANSGNIAAKSAPVEILALLQSTPSDTTALATPNLALALKPNSSRHYRLTFRVPTLAANTYELETILDPSNSLNSPSTAGNTILDSTPFTIS